MGHDTHKPKYGKGPSLEVKAQVPSANCFQAAAPIEVTLQTLARAIFDSFFLFQFGEFGFEFFVHRKMHITIQLNEIGKEYERSFQPFGRDWGAGPPVSPSPQHVPPRTTRMAD